MIPCPRCGSEGYVEDERDDLPLGVALRVCPACFGAGEVSSASPERP